MAAVEGSVVVIACAVMLLWLLASYLRAQHALQWWHRRQSLQLCRQAESIRDGLLQDSFVMRRNLELSLVNQGERSEQSDKILLSMVEKFHASLKQLSDDLSPPYVEDSLPLAIQYGLDAWKFNHPDVKFELDLPIHWQQESQEHSRLLLRAIDELLQITVSGQRQAALIAVGLTQQGPLAELKVHTTYSQASAWVDHTPTVELNYLRQTFRFLTMGECFYHRSDQSVTWYFRWRSPDHILNS